MDLSDTSGQVRGPLVYLTLYFTEFQLFPGQDEKYWPLMPALPSYGYGRDRKGPRFGSLIHGLNLRDVVITGSLFL